jgi:GT2 family glycosyltransferase
MPETNSVIAIVVTWNRQVLLRRCLLALQAQTKPLAEILVVDNACTDSTLEMLQAEFPLVKVRSMERNTGGAGGFAEGLRIAQQGSYGYYWLMDDDAWATPSALERLLEAQKEIQPPPTFVCSRVLDEYGESVNIPSFAALDPEVSWDRHLVRGWLPLNTCSFVSALIPRSSSMQAGLPVSHYFLWMDDAEYTFRLSKQNPGWYVTTSLVNHARPNGLRTPDLLLETSPSRIPLYKHYYSNVLETYFRHTDRFGKWWFVPHSIGLIKSTAHLLRRKEWKRILVLFQGTGLGLVRGFRWKLGKDRRPRIESRA